MANHGYFKSILLRRAPTALRIVVLILVGLVHASICGIFVMVGLISIGTAKPDSSQGLVSGLSMGFVLSAGFGLMAALCFFEVFRTSDSEDFTSREYMRRRSIEEAFLESESPTSFAKTLAVRYTKAYLLGGIVSIAAMTVLCMSGWSDSLLVIFANLAVVGLSGYLADRWIEHDLSNKGEL
jgi:hypothetical protein